MKFLIRPAIALLLTTSSWAEVGAVEWLEARSQYEAAVKPLREKYLAELSALEKTAEPERNTALATAYEDAVRPLREKYLEELRALSNTAEEERNLALAVAIRDEVAAAKNHPETENVVPVKTASSTKLKSTEELKEFLSDSTWSWNKTNEFTFLANGTGRWSNQKNHYVPWTVIDERTITLQGSTFHLSEDQLSFSGQFLERGHRSSKWLRKEIAPDRLNAE